MSIYIPEENDIYFSKTREYFQEVLSSYANKNYRSATVMLYSVAICDILFKLQELKDMYNDTVASQILQEIEKCRNTNDNKSKSKWEKELVDNIFKKTELLDFEAYTNLNHLYDYRNFSAHPALNDNFELISPSQETTIANIKNTLNNILIKPPIFIKNIINALTEDLKEKKSIYTEEYEKLEMYLNNKYFSRMSLSMKQKTFSSLWKICFCLPDDENCKNNLIINRKSLEILTKPILPSVIHIIHNDNMKYIVATDDRCTFNLIIFLSKINGIYKYLNEDTKLHIDQYIEHHCEAKLISWFTSENMKEHLEKVMTTRFYDLSDNVILALAKQCDLCGEKGLILDFYIDLYSKSRSYDCSDSRFYYYIEPFLNEMSRSQVIKLIKSISSNNQIYGRNSAYNSNTKIIEVCKDVLGVDFDYNDFINFNFDKKILIDNDINSENE